VAWPHALVATPAGALILLELADAPIVALKLCGDDVEVQVRFISPALAEPARPKLGEQHVPVVGVGAHHPVAAI